MKEKDGKKTDPLAGFVFLLPLLMLELDLKEKRDDDFHVISRQTRHRWMKNT